MTLPTNCVTFWTNLFDLSSSSRGVPLVPSQDTRELDQLTDSKIELLKAIGVRL